MQVSVIIVTYNSADFIQACIDSVLAQREVTFEVIVVDNASLDNTLAKLKSYGNKINVISNAENVGFAKANNQAAKRGRGDYFYLLNPDASLQYPNDLKSMIQFLEQNPKFGLAGSQVLKTSTDHYSVPQYYYPGQRDTEVDFSNLPGEIAWVIGASMFIRRAVFETADGFDETFFLYGEEADFCLRVRRLGYQIGYNPLVMVKHYGGASEITTSPELLWQKKQNGLHLFIKKNYPKEEGSKVVQRNLRRAQWRLFLLKCTRLFLRMDSGRKMKYHRYLVVYKTSKAFLAE